MVRRHWPSILTALVGVAIVGALIWLGISSQADEKPRLASGRPLPAVESNGYPVRPPAFFQGNYPCSQCHNADMPANLKHRRLRMAHAADANGVMAAWPRIGDGNEPAHATDAKGGIFLKHGGLWCLDCHDADHRDVLRSASGAVIKFEESYELCGQCHGERLRDWKAGVHGKRTGQWNGTKNYLLCVYCHSPHTPRYQPLAPEPPPARP